MLKTLKPFYTTDKVLNLLSRFKGEFTSIHFSGNSINTTQYYSKFLAEASGNSIRFCNTYDENYTSSIDISDILHIGNYTEQIIITLSDFSVIIESEV